MGILYRAQQWEGALMTTTTSRNREDLLRDLKDALVEYLGKHPGGTAPGAEAVHRVALEENVDPSYVTDAMWVLVEEGVAEYGRMAELTLTPH